MVILFDGLPLQTGSRGRGMGRYTANLLTALRAARPDWDLHLIVHADLQPVAADLIAGLPVCVFEPPLAHAPEARPVNDRYFADWLLAQQPDWVLHPAAFDEFGRFPVYADRRPRTAAVVYDFIPLLFPARYIGSYFEPGEYATRFGSLRECDLLLAISQATADDAVRFLGDATLPVVNIRGSADPVFAPLPPARRAAAEKAVRAKFGLTRPFLLHVGGTDWRKNLRGAIDGFAALPEAVRRTLDLVVTCALSPAGTWAVQDYAAKAGVGANVRVTGHVSDDELVALYHACRLLFFPSLSEGLGLPLIEAMRCGAAVATSNRSAMPEYAGPLSWYFDPEIPAAMARAITQALVEPKAARQAERETFAARFTWADTAARVVDALEQHRPPAAVPRRRRLAWVCPVPPEQTGIADYGLEVAGVLADRFDLDWVADPTGERADPAVARRFRVLTADEVDRRHQAVPYDLFVYHLGNNWFHTFMLPLLRRHPGLVVCHDVNLQGLFRFSHARGVWPGSYAEELEYNGDDEIVYWLRCGNGHPDVLSQMSPMHRRVFEGVPALVAHSGWSWQRLRRATDAPVSVIPLLAVPPPVGTREAERRRLDLPADRFVVATIGHVGLAKRVLAIVRAVAALPEDVRDRTLALFVGPAHAHDRYQVLHLAAELGVADHVRVVGKVPLDDLTAYAVAADVCIQCRYPSNGETSAGLARALAAGAACVTSDTATMSELPNTVSWKVRTPLLEVPDLADALTRLARDPELTRTLGANARQFMAETHGPAAVAAGYSAAVEHTIARLAAADMPWRCGVLNALADWAEAVPDGLIESWARLRQAAVARERPAVLPDLPELPAERSPVRSVAAA
jgi:glycosyltransferase involved in cell wall biosynthesis